MTSRQSFGTIVASASRSQESRSPRSCGHFSRRGSPARRRSRRLGARRPGRCRGLQYRGSWSRCCRPRASAGPTRRYPRSGSGHRPWRSPFADPAREHPFLAGTGCRNCRLVRGRGRRVRLCIQNSLRPICGSASWRRIQQRACPPRHLHFSGNARGSLRTFRPRSWSLARR
jgi:hypothetical protein